MLREGQEGQDAPHLGHGLGDEDAGHDGAAGEMPLEKGLINGDIFQPHHAFAHLQTGDAVHQEKG